MLALLYAEYEEGCLGALSSRSTRLRPEKSRAFDKASMSGKRRRVSPESKASKLCSIAGEVVRTLYDSVLEFTLDSRDRQAFFA